MGRPRNEDGGLHRLQLTEWKGKASVWVYGRRWVFGDWDVKKNCPAPDAESKFLKQVQLWAAVPAQRMKSSAPLLIELWADWRSSAHAPKNVLELKRIEREMFGTNEKQGPHAATTINGFGAPELLAWQTALCELKNTAGERRLGRKTVAAYVSRVRQCFNWGVAAGKVEHVQAAALTLVPAPARGSVKEPVKRRGVKWDSVEAVLPILMPPVRAVVELLWHTGARPSDIVGLKAEDVIRGGKILTESAIELDLDELGVWATVRAEHKTDWTEFDRVIFFGPKARQILQPFLDRFGEGHLFRPTDGRATSYAIQGLTRKPGGYGSYKKPKGDAAKRKPGECYNSHAIEKAVGRACLKAKITEWDPYQIRHTIFKRVQAQYGRDAARAHGGHRVGGATEDYAGFDLKTAAKVAREMG